MCTLSVHIFHSMVCTGKKHDEHFSFFADAIWLFLQCAGCAESRRNREISPFDWLNRASEQDSKKS